MTSDCNPPDRRFRVVRDSSNRSGPSPYRLLDFRGQPVLPVNEFLDANAARQFSVLTLRTYAFALRHLWQWLTDEPVALDQLTEAHLVRFLSREAQLGLSSARPMSPRSLNLRLVVLRSLYRFHAGRDLPGGPKTPVEPIAFWKNRTTGQAPFGPPRKAGRPRLRVRVPRRLVIPLKREDVTRFFESLRTWRDLAIVSLMLFGGLRSREVLGLKHSDLVWSESTVCVRGKGDKDRIVPLAPQAVRALTSYERLERPDVSHDQFFVCLKGRARGHPMTPSGLREIFRYHRRRSGVTVGNAHRFRHTFATDMVRAGMPLPILMRLMGHTQIEMTLRYVHVSADDVRQEFDRAIRRQSAPFRGD